MPLSETLLYATVACTALLALVMSATSAYVLFRYVRPIVAKLRPFVDKLDSYDPAKLGNVVQAEITEMAEGAKGFMAKQLTSTLTWAKDWVEGELIEKVGQEIEERFADLLIRDGASILGKRGAEARLQKKQIEVSKRALMDQALGGNLEMVEGIAEQFGIDPSQAAKWASTPMGQQLIGQFMQKLPGGGKPSQQQPPPSSPNLSGYKPLGGR